MNQAPRESLPDSQSQGKLPLRPQLQGGKLPCPWASLLEQSGLSGLLGEVLLGGGEVGEKVPAPPSQPDALFWPLWKS